MRATRAFRCPPSRARGYATWEKTKNIYSSWLIRVMQVAFTFSVEVTIVTIVRYGIATREGMAHATGQTRSGDKQM